MKKIYFIDDNKNLCIIWKLLFERHGYVIHVFHDGESALAKIKEDMPDVIITDYNLPGMDGVELLNKAQTSYDILPIMLTGDKEKLMNSNLLDKNVVLLAKPIQFEKIKNIIEKDGDLKQESTFAY